MRLLQYLFEKKSEFEVLKQNKTKLSDEERDQVMKAGAVWHNHFNRDGEVTATPAVWKSCDSKGNTKYVCNTHRAYQVRDTLSAAIKSFDFIKTTA